MKYIFYYLAIFVLGITVLNSCETDGNGPMPDNIEEGCLAYIKLDATSSGLINLGDVSAFKFAGSIDLVFEPDFDKLELVVVYNKDFANQYTLIDNITSTPHNFSLTLTDIINAIPALTAPTDIQIGDTFTFFVNATSHGKEYPIYVVVGGKGVRIVGSGLIQAMNNTEGADARADVTIGVPCAYIPANVSGSYHLVSPPSDWNSSGDITITVDPTNPFIVYVTGIEAVEGLVEDHGPFKMVIDPNSYNVSAAKQIIASDAFGYHNIAYAGTGKLNTCNGTYEMSFAISVDEGSFGTNAFTFTKN
jgi:hypothetical protein